jgi:hypothetical protein
MNFGAIDGETKHYILPEKALKGNLYTCVECNQKVILRQGDIRVHHFAHLNPTTKCKYYENPGESETHKHAKLLLKKWLEEKRLITLHWNCQNDTPIGFCRIREEYDIEYKDGDEVIVEYRDVNKKYIADIAVINNGNIRYIIEVKQSHRTTTNCRPEPWFEVEAKYVSEGLYFKSEPVYLENCRLNEKKHCVICKVKEQPWVLNIPHLTKKYGGERKWFQEKPCLICKRAQYRPEWIKGTHRQVCRRCLANHQDKLRALVINLVFGDD